MSDMTVEAFVDSAGRQTHIAKPRPHLLGCFFFLIAVAANARLRIKATCYKTTIL